MNNTFADADVAALLRIAGEVGELEQDVSVRRAHILNRLLDLIGGTWAVCSEMDPKYIHTKGWALPGTITHAGSLSPHDQDVINRYLTGTLASLDPCIPTLLRNEKPVVTYRREDVIDRAWYRSDHYNNLRRPLGLGESLYGTLTTPDGRRMKISLQRERHDSLFTKRHAQLLHVFNENLGGLYIAKPQGQAAGDSVSKTDLRVASLAPRLRPVLQRLLAGDAEKQAAMKLGLSPHTIHAYTKVLYRTFGVNSRGELLSKFVSEARA
ncbi:MAG TPA: LuxR C-terminal-related transcriptional regulator [Tepidisphaeraceae bacterium]|jgi:DNA-binding CsgD family transcriptional regulator|nr:LuxR C-terminal-related transcriptional regulator [Tepidisphaeraceae bacterium]